MGDRFAKSMRTFAFLWLSSSVFLMLAEGRHHHQQMSNFVSVNYLPDGRVETRVHYKGISAKETTISTRNASAGSTVREMTDGKRFIRLVYENDTLKDCNFGRRKERIRSLVEVFDDQDDCHPCPDDHQNTIDVDDDDVKENKNRTVSTSSLVLERLDDSKPLPKSVRKWFNYQKLRKLCRKKKKQRKQKRKKPERTKTTTTEKPRPQFTMTFDESASRSGRSHNAAGRSTGDGRRMSALVMPGTLWCGDRDAAPAYNSLGVFAETDRCCRRHDFCGKNIHAYARKYELLNERPFTISHCFCDASFRACLKLVGSTDADLVGKIFFNWVQTKCFVIKRKRVCAEWEGKKCVKKEIVKRAVLKTNLPY